MSSCWLLLNHDSRIIPISQLCDSFLVNNAEAGKPYGYHCHHTYLFPCHAVIAVSVECKSDARVSPRDAIVHPRYPTLNYRSPEFLHYVVGVFYLISSNLRM
jgi:hypothetical protein